MSSFIEVLSPGDRRSYVRVSSIERIHSPPSLLQGQPASPDEPLTIVLRDGTKIESYTKSALQILIAMLHEKSECVFLDSPDAEG